MGIFSRLLFRFFGLIIGLRQKNVSIALCSASVAEAVIIAEFVAAIVAEFLDELALSGCGGGLGCGCLIYGRAVGIYCKSFVMAKVGAASRAIHKSVRIPGAEIEIFVGVGDVCLAGFAGLAIGESAMPFCSLVSHFISSFHYMKTLFLKYITSTENSQEKKQNGVWAKRSYSV